MTAPQMTETRQKLPDLLHGYCPCQFHKLKPPRTALCGFLKISALSELFPPGVVPEESCVVCKELIHQGTRCPVCGKRNVAL